MKKAKIFLTGLTVLAVVGGALAFKAKTQNTFATCDQASKKCIAAPFLSFATTTIPQLGQPATFDLLNADCKLINNTFTCTTRTTIFQ